MHFEDNNNAGDGADKIIPRQIAFKRQMRLPAVSFLPTGNVFFLKGVPTEVYDPVLGSNGPENIYTP